jgi:hypothetical protein
LVDLDGKVLYSNESAAAFGARPDHPENTPAPAAGV